MNTHSHYRVKSLPTKPQNFLQNLFKRKRTKVIASIVGFYLVIGGGVGILLFNPNSGIAQASNVPVAVAAIFEINNIDAIVQNGVLDGTLTITNQSQSEELSNVALDMYSTKESVSWSEVRYKDSTESIKPTEKTIFKLLPLKKNSSTVINIKGLLNNKSLPNVGLMAKVTFDSKQGQLETTSNRILIKLSENASMQGALPNLKTDKLEYLAKEKVYFSLENFRAEDKGKIRLSIANKNTGELVANTLECQSDIQEQCLIGYEKLEPGKYGALFFDNNRNPASQIVNFEVKNSSTEISGTDFRANPNSTLELPFGSGSVNGQVSVLAQNVVEVNKVISDKDKCTFQILQAGSLLQQFQTPIVNKKCFSNLEMTAGPGIYQVKLLGSPIEKSFSFISKAKNSIAIQKISGGEKSQPLKFKLSGIQIGFKKTTNSSSTESSNTAPATSKLNAKISIHRIESGIVQEVSNFNNIPIQVENSEQTLELPANYFDLDGNYSVFVTLDNGQQSDFLNFEISDKNFGFTQSGITIKSGTELKLGQKNTFEIRGINYRNGKAVQSGTCENIIAQQDDSKVSANGEIKDGRCEFSVDNLKKSGSIIVSNPKLNLTSQFTIKDDKVANFGDINIANFPVFPNKANKIIAGPFTDQFGNPASQKGFLIQVENSFKNQVQIPIDVINGFGEAVIPSSLVNGEEIAFKLLDGDKEIASKSFEVSVENELEVPIIPKKIKSDERIRGLFYTNIMNESEKCKLKVISIGPKTIEQDIDSVLESKSCSLDWGPGDAKISARNLLELKVGNSKYTYLIDSDSDKDTKTFELTPNITDNGNGTVNLELDTSAIKDANDLLVQKGELEWTFGGKTKKTPIQNGVASLSLTLGDIDAKNLKREGENNFLSLEIDAKASEVSLSKTARLNLNLGKSSLSEKSSDFVPVHAKNIVASNSSNMWRFQTGACNVANNESMVKSYLEKDICLVQVDSGDAGQNKLVFRNGNSAQNTFEYTIVDNLEPLQFCEKLEAKCNIVVNEKINNLLVSTISKEGELTVGNSSSDPSVVSLIKEDAIQNQKYIIKISYNDEAENKINHYLELSGKALLEK
jgi:hypothetical protein